MYNLTKFCQNRMKNKKDLLGAYFFCKQTAETPIELSQEVHLRFLSKELPLIYLLESSY